MRTKDNVSIDVRRGSKKTGWEGGIRAIGFIYSAFTPFKDTRTSECRVHVTDWVPTILGMIARIANEGMLSMTADYHCLQQCSESGRLN